MARHSTAIRSGAVWPHGCWPNERQQLLLQACLLPDRAAALAAFHAWQQMTPLFFIDAGSHKLLLVLYHRLKSWDVHYAEMKRLGGLARYAWVRHQMLVRELSGVLRVLREADVDTLLLKGAALNATVYPHGRRLMADLDVMVPRARAQTAMRILQSHGWQPQFRNHMHLPDVTHGCHFQHGEHGHLDLHWDLFHGRPLRDAEQRDFWRAAMAVRIGEEPTLVLCPSDQLLHVCEHGLRYNDVPPFRWLADAYQVIAHSGAQIDWRRVAHLAKRYRLVLPVRDTLSYLERHLMLPASPAARAALRPLRAGLGSRLEHHLGTHRPLGSHYFWKSLPIALLNYVRVQKAKAHVRLMDYLALVNGLQPPLRQHLRLLTQVEWTALHNRLRAALRARQPQSNEPAPGFVSMGDIPEETLIGFHAPESCDGQIFRWSQPEACMHLRLRPARYRMHLHLLPVRSWADDIRHGLMIRLNRTTIAAASLRFENGTISFAAEAWMFADYDWQRLELRCPAWALTGPDPRRLGIPLVGVEIQEEAKECHEAFAA